MRKRLTITIAVFLIQSSYANAGVLSAADTKMSWQQCEAGLEFVNGQCTGSVKLMPWNSALKYCARLKGPLRWRLPGREELFNYYFSGQGVLHYTNLYWTSTTNIERPELAWYLIPVIGWVYVNYKELDGLVLCVADLK